jgi:CBS domain-containing protein
VLDQRMIREPIRLLRPKPRAPLTLGPDDSVEGAWRLMRDERVGCVLVVDNGALVGIVSERDLLMRADEPRSARPLREVMTPDPETLSPDDPIVYALNKMSVGGFRHVPLVDGAGSPVGVVSVKDVVNYIVDFFPNDVLTVPPSPAQRDVWHGRDGG